MCAPLKEPAMATDADRTTATALSQLRAQYQELLQRLENNQSEFQRLARSVYRVQEDERRRIARELHDGIGQNLTALKHQLAMIDNLLSPEQDDLRERLSASIALCAQTLDDTRQLSRLLRPQVLDDLGLDAALHWLARTIEGNGQLHIELGIEKLPALDTDLQTLLFRIAQEALANVVRHAKASDVLLRVATRAGRVMLTVWDNGIGFDPASALTAASEGRSAGLAGMRERARLYGGELQIESGADTGTWLRASFALPPPARGPVRT
jgi:signal transduction histidine kinase